MKRLVLENYHKDHNAKLVDYAGFKMPIHYTGVKSEHYHVRKHVGVFDVSHMGEIVIRGPQSELFLENCTTNDISKLSIGNVQYSCFTNINGGTIDDLLVYKIDFNEFMLVVNASNIDKDFKWLNSINNFDCQIINESDDTSLLAIQGPESQKLLFDLGMENIYNLKYYNFYKTSICKLNNVLVSRTGYTGEIGFEIYVKNKDIGYLWNKIFSVKSNLKPIGLAARDTLRLEMGYCLYGNELSDTISPIEANLYWIVSKNKKFIGSKETFEKNKRILIGLELLERGIARHGYEVYDDKKDLIGVVTSGTMSPSLEKSIALAIVYIQKLDKTKNLFVSIRKKFIKAKKINYPFYEKK
ncbi:glycine cleavage system aminomethyltransferase GcvT [Bacteroidota bacterium]|nr:glycine cleavage system aminomethyltransferase GcvT [Bacteroidota bacterium]